MIRLAKRSRTLAAAAVACCLLATAGLSAAPKAKTTPKPAATAPGGVDAAAVNLAVRKAKDYLYSQQNDAGTWEDAAAPQDPAGKTPGLAAQDTDIGQWGGQTSLALYALLAAGESPTEPKLAKAVEFVKTASITGTYAVGVRMLALSYLPFGDDVKAAAAAEAGLLLKTVKTQGDASGHYDYNVLLRDSPDTYSHSRSQYGTLGMWAAAKMGYNVPPAYWQLVDAGWRRNQRADGGWNYFLSDDPRFGVETLGMTAAGVASLFITSDALNGDRAKGCGGNVVDPNIEGGLSWIAKNFEEFDPADEYARDWKYPTLYGLERVGAASGLRSIGGNDWYARGVGWLLPLQRKDGSFKSAGKTGDGAGRVIDTGFALLFLGRGRSPLLAAKLAHGDAVRGDWNQRPRDLANLAALHRQRRGKGAAVRDRHRRPHRRAVAGRADAVPVRQRRADPRRRPSRTKLREYAQKGGLIVLNSRLRPPRLRQVGDGAGQGAVPAVRLARAGGDEPDLLDAVPTGRRPPAAAGDGAGQRRAGADGADRQTATSAASGRRAGDETALQFGANLYLYSVDRDGQRFKGESYLVAPDPAKAPTRAAAVGRVKYDGNWDPEPAGWPRLAAVLHNEYDTELAVKAVDPAKDDLAGLTLLHLTGTADFKLAPAARAKVKAFVEGGGTLLVDAAGGSSAFGAAADREMRAIFGDAANALTQPAADLPLYKNMAGAPPLKVDYRLAAVRAVGETDKPLLRAIVDKTGRAAVIVSSQDLSVGLVGMPVAGVVGYTPASATSLVARAVRAESLSRVATRPRPVVCRAAFALSRTLRTPRAWAALRPGLERSYHRRDEGLERLGELRRSAGRQRAVGGQLRRRSPGPPADHRHAARLRPRRRWWW